MHIYALVVLAVFVAAWFPVQVLLIKHRNHNFIKSRGFFFFVVQNIGLLISGTATGLYAGLQGKFDCYAFFTISWTGFPLFALPFLLRVWEYGVNFHISAVRAKLSVADFEVSERRRSESVHSNASSYFEGTFESDLSSVTKTSWFYRHRWTYSRSFLLKLFFVASWIYMAPAIIFTAIYAPVDKDIYRPGHGCKTVRGIYEILAIFIFSFGIVGVLLVAFIRKARDIFFIKVDMICVALTWLIIGIAWLVYSSLSTPHAFNTVPHSFLLLVAFCISFLCTMVYPLVLVYKNPPASMRLERSASEIVIGRTSDNPVEEFIASLQLPHFRNSFHKFLVLQFCAESLLFYETVTNWKNSYPTSSSKSKTKYQANAIFNHFLKEHGICTINVSSESVNAIEGKLLEGAITQDMFDEPLKETVNLMFTNSYYPFLKSDLYKNTQEVSLKTIM